mmetsp:Transcript_91832/g.278991  ORF Transcript_91832/g.278991 Transcript_91832/m.278991 type:complete len:236 (-) Transcript_91832:309-1016(-)
MQLAPGPHRGSAGPPGHRQGPVAGPRHPSAQPPHAALGPPASQPPPFQSRPRPLPTAERPLPASAAWPPVASRRWPPHLPLRAGPAKRMQLAPGPRLQPPAALLWPLRLPCRPSPGIPLLLQPATAAPIVSSGQRAAAEPQRGLAGPPAARRPCAPNPLALQRPLPFWLCRLLAGWRVPPVACAAPRGILPGIHPAFVLPPGAAAPALAPTERSQWCLPRLAAQSPLEPAPKTSR